MSCIFNFFSTLNFAILRSLILLGRVSESLLSMVLRFFCAWLMREVDGVVRFVDDPMVMLSEAGRKVSSSDLIDVIVCSWGDESPNQGRLCCLAGGSKRIRGTSGIVSMCANTLVVSGWV